MWSLKFKVFNEDSIYTVLTKKYKVTDYFYPVDVYKRGNGFHILGIHLLEGEDKEKKSFANALKKHKKTVEFEQHDNMLVVLMKEEEKFYELIYDPSLFHPSPAVIKEGYENWDIASYQREKLEKLMHEIEKDKKAFPNFELLNLKKTDLHEIYFPKILPELPEKQKAAFQLALRHGYYTYPRRADLKYLAGIMKISISTYQEHLRKAEAKLLPFFAESLKIK